MEAALLDKARFVKGRCKEISNDTYICHAGMGIKNAFSACQQLADVGCQCLVGLGFAGSLSSHVIPGNLILPTHIRFAELDYAVTTCWRDHIVKKLGISNNSTMQKKLVDFRSETILLSLAFPLFDKRQWRREESAQDKNVYGVDMESGAIAKFASENNLPFIVVKAISDGIDDIVPHSVAAAIMEDGTMSYTRLVASLLRSPSQFNKQIRALNSLWWGSRLAKETLTSVINTTGKRFDYDSKNTVN